MVTETNSNLPPSDVPPPEHEEKKRKKWLLLLLLLLLLLGIGFLAYRALNGGLSSFGFGTGATLGSGSGTGYGNGGGNGNGSDAGQGNGSGAGALSGNGAAGTGDGSANGSGGDGSGAGTGTGTGSGAGNGSGTGAGASAGSGGDGSGDSTAGNLDGDSGAGAGAKAGAGPGGAGLGGPSLSGDTDDRASDLMLLKFGRDNDRTITDDFKVGLQSGLVPIDLENFPERIRQDVLAGRRSIFPVRIELARTNPDVTGLNLFFEGAPYLAVEFTGEDTVLNLPLRRDVPSVLKLVGTRSGSKTVTIRLSAKSGTHVLTKLPPNAPRSVVRLLAK